MLKKILTVLGLLLVAEASIAAVPSGVTYDFGGPSPYANLFATGSCSLQAAANDTLWVELGFVPSLVNVWVADDKVATTAAAQFVWFTGMDAGTAIVDADEAGRDSIIGDAIWALTGAAGDTVIRDNHYLMPNDSSAVTTAGDALVITGFRLGAEITNSAGGDATDIILWYAIP